MVPTMIAMMLDHPEFRPERLASLRDLVYGASPMPAALLERLLTTLPDLNLWQGYGMTECSVGADVAHRRRPPPGRRDPALGRSAGRSASSVAIRDAEGDLVARRARTVRCAHGRQLHARVLEPPEQTGRRVPRRLVPHRRRRPPRRTTATCYLVDRVKDMIVTGGENVYSIEVENAISTHPAVAAGRRDRHPPRPCGVSRCTRSSCCDRAHRRTEDEIKDHARESIAGYKVPKSVEFRTEPLPLSGALKPLKRELRPTGNTRSAERRIGPMRDQSPPGRGQPAADQRVVPPYVEAVSLIEGLEQLPPVDVVSVEPRGRHDGRDAPHGGRRRSGPGPLPRHALHRDDVSALLLCASPTQQVRARTIHSRRPSRSAKQSSPRSTTT